MTTKSLNGKGRHRQKLSLVWKRPEHFAVIARVQPPDVPRMTVPPALRVIAVAHRQVRV